MFIAVNIIYVYKMASYRPLVVLLFETGFGKSLHENFIAQDDSYTQDVSMHNASTVQH